MVVTTYNKLRDYLRQVTSPQLTKIHINFFNVKNTSNQCSIWKLFSGLKDNYFYLSDNFIAKKDNKINSYRISSGGRLCPSPRAHKTPSSQGQ